MGSGAIVVAAYARIDPVTLTVNAGLIYAAFNTCWLPLFWRMAARAGVPAPPRELASEAVWLGTRLAPAIWATALLGPRPRCWPPMAR